MPEKAWTILAAGGTAGHIFPALAVADELEERGFSTHLLSAKRGLAKELLAETRLPATYLEGKGLQRKLKPSSIKQNMSAVKELYTARKKAIQLLKDIEPKIAVSFGGYAAMPCAMAAKKLQLPLVVVEPNVTPGMVNKRASRWADVSAVGFKTSTFSNSTVTGVPIRKEIAAVRRKEDLSAAKKELQTKGISADAFLVIIVSGSLGSKKLNDTVWESLQSLSGVQNLNIYHVVGRRDWNPDIEKLKEKHSFYRAVAFEDSMEQLYAAGDLFICRAGAGMLAELATTSTPSVLVPLSDDPGNHQTANARFMESEGGAEILKEVSLTPESLVRVISKYMSKPEALKEMAKNLEQENHANAAGAIADLLEAHARR